MNFILKWWTTSVAILVYCSRKEIIGRQWTVINWIDQHPALPNHVLKMQSRGRNNNNDINWWSINAALPYYFNDATESNGSILTGSFTFLFITCFLYSRCWGEVGRFGRVVGESIKREGEVIGPIVNRHSFVRFSMYIYLLHAVQLRFDIQRAPESIEMPRVLLGFRGFRGFRGFWGIYSLRIGLASKGRRCVSLCDYIDAQEMVGLYGDLEITPLWLGQFNSDTWETGNILRIRQGKCFIRLLLSDIDCWVRVNQRRPASHCATLKNSWH